MAMTSLVLLRSLPNKRLELDAAPRSRIAFVHRTVWRPSLGAIR